MILPEGPFMGSAEIGDLFGVSRQRVQQIIAKRDFPAPYTELAMGKIWLASDVCAWGVAAKRLPADAAPGPVESVTLTVDNREGTFTPSEPTELPDHQARKDLFEEHLTIEDYTAYVRAEREAHAAGTPKFALPEPLLPEALSLGVYIRARADRKL